MHLAKRAAVMLLTVGMLASLPSVAHAALTPQERAQRAAGYIIANERHNGSIPSFSVVGSTADGVVALTAANRGTDGIRKAVRFLATQVSDGKVDTIGETAKVIMAAEAANRDAHDFGGDDLVDDILSSEQPDGRYGVGTPVFDQADAVLALVAAGETPSGDALDWLAAAQCPDGGWQFDEPYDGGTDDDEHCNNGDAFDFFYSDTNTSGLAVMALAAANGPGTTYDPFEFFTDIRDDVYGGWGYTWGFDTTDANSTSLVIQAYKATQEPLPAGAFAALKALQYNACGAFSYSWVSPGVKTGPDLGATVGAVQGIIQKPSPVVPKTVTKYAPATPECPA